MLYGDDELLITYMPKEEVERYHISLEDLFFPSFFGENNSESLKLYLSLSCLSCITVVIVSKCFFLAIIAAYLMLMKILTLQGLAVETVYD